MTATDELSNLPQALNESGLAEKEIALASR
jgi:hypothetical protein